MRMALLYCLLLCLVSGCLESKTKKAARDVWGKDAKIQCQEVKNGWACENLCTHKVFFCTSETSGCSGEACYFVNDIQLDTPSVTCPKAERP